MMRHFGLFIGLPMLLALPACAGLPAGGCGPGLMRMTQAQLFFGRDIQRRALVSDEQWRAFLDEEVTLRFPDGFSVADVSGQYRDQSGTIVREPSKQLLIFMRDIQADEPKLSAIRDAYKRRFN